MANLRPRILCVDDEPHVLDGLVRVLRAEFAVTTAVDGMAGLEALQRQGPFAVVVSDMRMPGLDGVALLRRAREIAPLTVRVLLTGHADLEHAIAAVNQGQVFRFLTKPCPSQMLINGLDAAVQQYRLVTAERELLERTLHGSVKLLTDLLAQTHPAAFGRATRAKQYVSEITLHLGIADRWHIEVAAMLSQIGCVTLPAEIATKVYHAAPLTEEEQAMVDRLPAHTEALLANIPRLEPVREILQYQGKQFDGQGPPRDRVLGEAIPLGARILKPVLDFDVLQARGLSIEEAFNLMRGRHGWYDPEILQAFSEVRGSAGQRARVLELPLRAVEPGMVFLEDVRTLGGLLLIARGQEVTESLAERVRCLRNYVRVAEPVRVVLPKPRTAEERPTDQSHERAEREAGARRT